MNTTYDELYVAFLLNCPNNDIPSTNEGKYAQIQNAISFYNLKSNTYKDHILSGIKGNNTSEMLDFKLKENELLLFSHCMKLAHLKSELTFFISLYSTFTKETGIKEYRGQVSAREVDIKATEDFITSILEDSIEDWEV